MKKRTAALFLIAFFLLPTLLNGCHLKLRTKTPFLTGFHEPEYILDANMPYADLASASFDEVERLEQDDFGKAYYRYYTYSTFLGQNIIVDVISQKEGTEALYYYRDNCYMFRLEDSEDFTQEQIDALKERNDWGLPFQEDKCSCILYPTKETLRPLIYLYELEPMAAEYLNISEEKYWVIANALETNGPNQQVFFIVVSPKLEERLASIEECQFYLLLYDQTKKDPIVTMEEVEFTYSCQDFMQEFRNNWLSS